MPQRKKFPKPKLVVSNNVVDLAAVREEKNLPTFVVDFADDRSECKAALEDAIAEFEANETVTGGIITLITENGELFSHAGGVTLDQEVLFLTVARDERKAEWAENYGGYGEDVEDAE